MAWSDRFRPRGCAECGRTFQPRGSRERWCSAICALWATIEVRGEDECWPTTLAPAGAGYVLLNVQGQKFYAHVIACEEVHGPIPKGMYAKHSCDNPPCCNGAHLSPGSPASNLSEAHDRGRRHGVRYAKGADHGRSRERRAKSGCV